MSAPENTGNLGPTGRTYRQASYATPLLFEYGRNRKNKKIFTDIECEECGVPSKLKRTRELDLPQLSELEVVRHYTQLSQMNYGVDSGFYPLGSCTMKYNPKICEEIAGNPSVENIHPYQDEKTLQGALQIMYELQNMLCEIGGVDAVSLQPAAGAHGEFAGMLVIDAYHRHNKQDRTEVILPDTAHGTNPASAAMVGYNVIEIPSKNGQVDMEALKSALSDKTAALMLTNPNTLGIFEENILEIAKLVHKSGALLYYDGANLNGMMGKARPGDMGFDVLHFNLHKTFATPHGGGGPGSGPIGVKETLAKFLPVPVVGRNKEYFLDYNKPFSIGKVKNFYGNFSVMVKAYVYIKMMGKDGLGEATDIAVLNANYMKEKLKAHFELPYDGLRKHEFVLSGAKLKAERGVRTLDVSKRLLDYGYHAPTIYFPHLVDEAIMIEPTETESKQELDRFIDTLIKIKGEDPNIIKSAPHNTAIGRVDEVGAAKDLMLTWKTASKKFKAAGSGQSCGN